MAMGFNASGEPFGRGLVEVYTGHGKGKTTAALGLALRAAGQGFRTCIIQFMKGVPYGELVAVEAIPAITIRQFGSPDWVHPDNVRAEDRERAAAALTYAIEIVTAAEHDLVVLDEVNIALSWGLIPVAAVLDLIRVKPECVELVLTGRDAPDEVVAAADLVTEMREVKHPYHKGIPARRGIEY
jgi:cob(I)alamin adenosyltransferase